MVFTLVLGLIAFLVLYPLLLVFLNSFEVAQPGVPATAGLDNWRAVFGDRQMVSAIKNTITLAVTRQAIALVLGVGLAWLIARTNLPGRNWLELGFWVALFLPTLTVTLGWILLLDGSQGLINRAFVNWVPLVDDAPFEIFSWWGIVLVHLMTGTVAVQVMLLTPAFRGLNASLEEASLSLGAGPITTLRRVIVPALLPVIVVVTLVGIIRSMDAFEIELVLGIPDNINVYSTLIFREVIAGPSQTGNAAAIGVLFLGVLVPFIALQWWLSHRRTETTSAATYAPLVQDLGRWRWPTFAIVAGVLSLTIVVPVLLVVLSTIMSFFGLFVADGPWTLATWSEAAGDPDLLGAVKSSLLLGSGAALIAMTAFMGIAYIIARSQTWDRRALDFVTWLPATIPGIVIGLGFLLLSIGPMIPGTEIQWPVPIHGSAWVLMAVVAIGSITLGVQATRSQLAWLGPQLEEASRASGASALYTMRRIVFPLILPAVVLVGVLTFVTAIRATSLIAVLTTTNNKPLSVLQLDHMANGDLGPAAVIGVLLVLLIAGAGLLGRLFGLSVDLHRDLPPAASQLQQPGANQPRDI